MRSHERKVAQLGSQIEIFGQVSGRVDDSVFHIIVQPTPYNSGVCTT